MFTDTLTNCAISAVLVDSPAQFVPWQSEITDIGALAYAWKNDKPYTLT